MRSVKVARVGASLGILLLLVLGCVPAGILQEERPAYLPMALKGGEPRMADYYVDPTGADGDGSIGSPWNNIAGHINSLSAGDRLLLRSTGGVEVYTESEIDITVSGSSGSPITVMPYQEEEVEIRKSAGGGYIFDISGDWIVLDGQDQMDINRNDSNGTCIYVREGADDVKLLDLSMHGARNIGSGGVRVRGDRLTISGVTIYDMSNGPSTDSHGINYQKGTGLVVENSTIYDVSGDGIQVHDDYAIGTLYVSGCEFYTTLGKCSENGIDIKRGTATILDTTFHGFRHCDSTCGGSGGPGAAIIAQKQTGGLIVDRCTIYDCALGFLLNAGVDESFTATIQRTLIYGLVDDDATPAYQPSAALRLSGRTTVYWYNNTVVGGGDADPQLWDIQHALSELTVYNCIHDGTGSIDDAVGSLTADYNLWHDETEQASGPNDVEEDPLFVGGGDYSLQAASPAIDAGKNVGLPFFGSAPDMGAFEYQGEDAVVSVVVVLIIVVVVVTVVVVQE